MQGLARNLAIAYDRLYNGYTDSNLLYGFLAVRDGSSGLSLAELVHMLRAVSSGNPELNKHSIRCQYACHHSC